MHIELIRGQVTFKDGSRSGDVLRTAGVIGCTVAVPKNRRKGCEHAFRIDLPEPDSEGETKYIISVDTGDEMAHWMNIFGAYTTMSPDQIAEVAEAASAAAERAMRESFAPGEGFDGDGDVDDGSAAREADMMRQSRSEKKAAEEAAKAEQERREEAERLEQEREAERLEVERVAAELAEQERAQAEIARGMEQVAEAALERSILLSRIPKMQGSVQVQFSGKKQFSRAFLELVEGVLRFKDEDEMSALSNATVAGCTVGELKQPRKGHDHAFRLDLAEKDSLGVMKYVLSVGARFLACFFTRFGLFFFPLPSPFEPDFESDF